MQFRRSLPLITTLVMLLLPAQQSLAHEGQDHDATAKTVTVPASPRAGAASESFELVAVARSGEVVIYLDRLATNEPVPNATVVV